MLIDSLVNRFFYAGFNVTSLNLYRDLDTRTAPDWEPFLFYEFKPLKILDFL
jgi:hypothetical protein